ncbi:MAG: hypothetical protein K9N35_04730 [Candidatus Marinimicrobia bacterium]|nr:hypothetical protein [Candidatus Neomarinimicrobiota bacterium]
MIHSKDVKARLFFTYLKDKTELFLYVKPHDTTGSRCVYRRAPGDAAMSYRIHALLENTGVLKSEIEIWVLLYPPEIRTTTIYAPSGLSDKEISVHIHENVLLNQPYSLKYDWKNYLLQRRDNGHDEDMVTITFLGKNVLPRIRSLLGKDTAKINFIGDGLQFLNVNMKIFPQLRGQTYELILPYDEIYYKAIIRSGVHFESLGLPHGCSAEFGHYKLRSEQVYLKMGNQGSKLDLPVFQPLVPVDEWKETYLTPSAFPSWYIALRSMDQETQVNFAERFHQEEKLVRNHTSLSIGPAYGYSS